MITQIVIKNFQSHEETTLDLHEGVNALVGLTGSGKSVVFKAMDWLFRNRPLGEEYRSWWGGDTLVEITLKEGCKVGRVRTGSDNFYYISPPGLQMKRKRDDFPYREFRAFGNGPPPQPVLDLLNLSDVNFQAQADPSFLISNSSGEVARYLNKAAHLDVIDQVLGNIAGTLRKEREELGRSRADFDKAQEDLKTYDWLKEAEERLGTLEQIQSRAEWVGKQRLEIGAILGEYGLASVALVAVQQTVFYSGKVDALLSLHGDIERRNSEWEQLAAVVDQHEKMQKEFESLGGVVDCASVVSRLVALEEEIRSDRAERCNLGDIVHDHKKISEELAALNAVFSHRSAQEKLRDLAVMIEKDGTEFQKLRGLIGDIEWTKDALDDEQKEERRLREKFKVLMPNVCPLCDQEIKK
jgi:DNA repair protein SbcC/Rad50